MGKYNKSASLLVRRQYAQQLIRDLLVQVHRRTCTAGSVIKLDVSRMTALEV